MRCCPGIYLIVYLIDDEHQACCPMYNITTDVLCGIIPAGGFVFSQDTSAGPAGTTSSMK